MPTVTLSLISHTNVGKTTLARTLLRRDVGEVRDQAHVTEVSEAYDLIETGGDRLRLWDTPGFGDTARLMRRLRHEKDPLGWFLHQVWDRVMDRPLWCGQEAARNIKDEADVVLYLVNAAEEPADAGYVSLELELLEWMKRPVLLLLNQLGDDERGAEERWRAHVASTPVVRDVLSLDAFARGWPQEGVLLERVEGLLDGERRLAMRRLRGAWEERNLEVFRHCCGLLGTYLARAAADREVPREGAPVRDASMVGTIKGALGFHALDKRKAMRALGERLDRATADLMRAMIEAHGLYGESVGRIEQKMRDFQVRGAPGLDEKTGALAGAVVSGALGGLAADALAGGLTLGGGMIAGGILGALGGSALAKGYRVVGGREEPSVQWTTEFVRALCRQAALRYLAVAHFGRGRGEFRDVEQPAHWSAAVDAALAGRVRELDAVLARAGRERPAASDASGAAAGEVMRGLLERVLRDFYGRPARTDRG